MERFVLKLAYYGPDFEGYARQPGMHTVEGELMSALRRIDAWKEGAVFISSSRTDRGVSSLGNAVAFDGEFRLDELVNALNANLTDVYVLGVARVGPDFNPRMAEFRDYVYFFGEGAGFDLDAGADAAGRLVGVHNFNAFRKKDHRNPTREILSASIATEEGNVVFRVRGRNFLWQQVRRMAGAVMSVMQGKADAAAITNSLDNGEGEYPPLPPEYLTLEHVELPGVGWRDASARSVMVRLEPHLRRECFLSLLRQMATLRGTK